MIPNFPMPFVNELFSSLIARQRWPDRAGDCKFTAQHISFHPHSPVFVDLPAEFGAICAAAGDGEVFREAGEINRPFGATWEVTTPDDSECKKITRNPV